MEKILYEFALALPIYISFRLIKDDFQSGWLAGCLYVILSHYLIGH